MSTHPHKEIIDAWTADTSIEFEESVRLSDGSNLWIAIDLESVIKRPHDTFRIKPKMRSVTVDGVKYEWPEPMHVAPLCDTTVYFTSLLAVITDAWLDVQQDNKRLELRLCHATKEGAEAHRRALIAVSGGEL